MNSEHEAATPATNEFLNNLRNHTSYLHSRLENLPVSLSLISKDLTKEDYTVYLQLMYAIVADLENNIFPKLNAIIPLIDSRRKLPLIESDLRYFNIETNTPIEYPLTNRNKDISIAFALGIMYVMEGSALGGRIILKNVEKTLGLNEKNGCTYFAGYQSETGRLWKEFLSILQEYQHKLHAESEIIDGANFAFNSIYNFMQQKTTGNDLWK